MPRSHPRVVDYRTRQVSNNRAALLRPRTARPRSVPVAFATVVLLMVFCLTLTWWTWHLLHMTPVPVHEAAITGARSIGEAGTLFGGRLNPQEKRAVHVAGVLALHDGAAAIVGVGDAPPRALPRGATIAPGATLEEVRVRSVVVDRNGTRAEVMLPPVSPNRPDGAIIYVR